MKTSTIERIFILLSFNLYRIATILFAIMLIVVVLCYSFFNYVFLSISYVFWFSFGFFGFSIAIKKATSFLEKKHNEKNDYYFKLLKKT